MAKVLTAKSVETMKPDPNRRLEIPDAALPGLYLVLQPGGARSWAFRYRCGGKSRKLTIGSFPAISLAAARDEARKAAQAVATGTDPGAVKAERQAAARAAVVEPDRDTVRAQVEEFDKRHLSKIRSGKAARRFLDRFVVAKWGDRDVHDIAKRDVIELLDGIVDAGTPTTANRVLAQVRKFMNWLVERDVLERSPVAGVKPPAKEESRDRVLSDDELRWIWTATAAEGQPFGPLTRFLLLTGQRLGEGVGMTDREVTGGLWHLTAARTKNGRAHAVPLSSAAMEVLASVRRIKGDRRLVFTTTGATPVSGFDRAIKRLRKRAEEVAAAERGGPVEIAPWGFHDLRRTAATGMAGLGFPVHVVEAVLNHASGSVSGIAAVYNRHNYADEKRAALEAWGRHVLELVGERPAGENVVKLEAARS